MLSGHFSIMEDGINTPRRRGQLSAEFMSPNNRYLTAASRFVLPVKRQ